MPSSKTLSKLLGLVLHDSNQYRIIIGALKYCILTRLEIAYLVNKLCQFLHAFIDLHQSTTKIVLRYLYGTASYGVVFQKSFSLSINAYCDVDQALCMMIGEMLGAFAFFRRTHWFLSPMASRGLCQDLLQRQNSGLLSMPQHRCLRFKNC